MGHVTLIWREKDGRTHVGSADVYRIRYVLHNLKFCQGDEAFLREHLDNDLFLDDDQVTDTRSGSWPKAPDYYGLVVVDFVSGTILVHQGKTSIGFERGIFLSTGDVGQPAAEFYFKVLVGEEKFTDADHAARLFDNDDYRLTRFRKLFEAGRLASIEMFRSTHSGESIRELIDFSQMSFADVLRLARKDLETHISIRYHFDYSPLKVIDVHPSLTRKQAKGLREYVLKMGFALDAKDEAAWKAWIEDKCEA